MHDLVSDLNPEQRKAVTHGQGPLLIVAGAGTGKTTVIAKRIAWLIGSGLAKPEEILALTFTEKAAAELEERVDRLLPIGYIELWAMTFHGFGQRILEERGLDIGLSSDATLLDETGSWLMVRERLKDFGLDYYRPLGNPAKFIHDLLKHFSRAKDELITPADYRAYAEAFAGPAEEKTRLLEVAGAYETYEKSLLASGFLDFGNLITQVIRLLKERPNVLAEYRKRFRYILVDEFQDTNFAQYELVKLLSGADGNLTVVGDDDQSIYKFRGASVSNILAFKDDFPSATSVALTRNYRSKQEILDVAYRFIRQNDPNRLESRLGLSKRLVAERGGDGAVTHVTAPDIADEARFVAEEIMRLKDGDPETSWGDFAILFRANDHAKPFIESLATHSIPHLYVASKGLYLKPVIQDAICYLKLLDNYHESPAMVRVLNWPLFGLHAKDIVQLTHEAKKRGDSVYAVMARAEELGFDTETAAKLHRVRALIEKHSERARRTGPARLLKEIFVDTGYYAELLREETPATLEAIALLNQFVRRIQAYEHDDPRPTLGRFMQELEWEMESGEEGSVPMELSEGPDTVKLMTAHTSKGLEFRHVFVVQLVDARFPGRNRSEAIPFPNALVKETLPTDGDAHLEEERRLFYVAATRARDRLYLTGAEDVGGARKKKPSRFVSELFADAESSKLITAVVRKGAAAFLEDDKAADAMTAYTLELPSHFSFSQLAAFEKCPLQYKFAHLLKIPTLDKGVMNFGKTVHAVLERFIAHYQEHPDAPMPLETLIAHYEELWTGEWFEDADDRDRHHAAGLKAIGVAHAQTLRDRPTPWLQEAPFTLKIGKYVLKGMIDRVDKLPDGRAVIIDYKTGRAPKEVEAGMKDQLRIYQLAVADVYGAETAAMRFWYIRDNEAREVEPDSGKLDKIRERLEKRLAELETSDFAATPSARTCGSCDFSDLCRFKVL